jgi:hypothetical protein
VRMIECWWTLSAVMGAGVGAAVVILPVAALDSRGKKYCYAQRRDIAGLQMETGEEE